jgi:hypothetical protein
LTVPDAASAAIRFGILYGGSLEKWQLRCLEHLAAVPGVQTPVKIERAQLAQSRARLRELELDFMLCFVEGALSPDILNLPRYGVWRYEFGDWVTYRGAPHGFWEVYDDCPVSAAMLVRVQPDPAVVDVLRDGFLRTRRLSARNNRQQLLERFTHWPAQVCRDIGLGRLAPQGGATPTLRTGAATRGPPTLLQRSALGLCLAWRVAATGFHALFRHDQWNIGIVDRPIEQFLNIGVPRPIHWLPATRRAELRADPFGVIFAGAATILCEHFSYEDNLGYIVAIEADLAVPGTRVHIGPAQPVHLSYPFLFEADGKLLCIPESSAAQELALYEVEQFPNRWRKVATLVAGRGYADASVFQFEGRWWLAACEVADKGSNCELHLWFAATPSGPWQAHLHNPVKIDVRSARPAGAPFWVDGALYRPAQDCSTTYGARVIINRVLALSPNEYREEAAASVNPDPSGPYPAGLHTISAFGDKTLIDGKRTVFVAAEFLRVLRIYLP